MALTDAELKRAILDELRRHSVLTLATVGDDGPHAVSLMYSHDAFDIYWLSDPGTRHSRHVAAGSTAAVTIAAQQENFEKVRGLQLTGAARIVADAGERAAALRLLSARYPFLERFAAGELAWRLQGAAVYRFRPRTLTLIDNSRGFGFKQTLELPD